MSAVRGGWQPCCIDAFADVDLTRLVKVIHLPEYPRGIAKAARELPPAPWIYTGGLENRSRLVHGIATRTPLWGNSAEVLRQVRDPFHWTAILHQAGFPTLDVRPFDNPPRPDGTWLRKPIRSAGGIQIERWTDPKPTSRRFFFQRIANGVSYSATFLATSCTQGNDVRLVGIVRHIADRHGLHAPPFGWCGGVTVRKLAGVATESITQVGRILANQCRLTGLFGIDFLWDGETVWPVEINPRYTATGELWDAVYQRSLIADHIDACKGIASWPTEMEPTATAAKLIVYAPRTLIIPNQFPEAMFRQITQSNSRELPPFADIPHADTNIPASWPICTVTAVSDSESATLGILRKRLAWLAEQLPSSEQDIAWHCQF